MEAISEIEVRVSGIRGSGELSPATLDIRELKDTLERVNALLIPIVGRSRPPVTYEMKEGSVRHIFRTSTQIALMVSAILSKVSSEGSLDFLDVPTARAIEAFQLDSIQNNVQFIITTPAVPGVGLEITPSTHYLRNQDLLVACDFYLYGEVTKIGGKGRATIQIQTPDLGSVVISAPKEELAKLEDNVLYHIIGVYAKGLHNPYTRELDGSSLVFQNFLEHSSSYNASYLENLITKARSSWAGVPDAAKWLRDLRGYEGA